MSQTRMAHIPTWLAFQRAVTPIRSVHPRRLMQSRHTAIAQRPRENERQRDEIICSPPAILLTLLCLSACLPVCLPLPSLPSPACLPPLSVSLPAFPTYLPSPKPGQRRLTGCHCRPLMTTRAFIHQCCFSLLLSWAPQTRRESSRETSSTLPRSHNDDWKSSGSSR